MKKLMAIAVCVMLLGCESPTPTSHNAGANPSGQIRGTGRGGASDRAFIGIVENGRLRVLLPEPVDTRFTSIQMQEAVSPETGELNLAEYEGSAIAIEGHDGGGWVYSARVTDKGGPIVTALVRHASGR